MSTAETNQTEHLSVEIFTNYVFETPEGDSFSVHIPKEASQADAIDTDVADKLIEAEQEGIVDPESEQEKRFRRRFRAIGYIAAPVAGALLGAAMAARRGDFNSWAGLAGMGGTVLVTENTIYARRSAQRNNNAEIDRRVSVIQSYVRPKA